MGKLALVEAGLVAKSWRRACRIVARAARTIAALLAFLAAGHTPATGAFRSHVARLVEFLKSLGGLPEMEARLIGRALDAASKGRAPKGDWLKVARGHDAGWRRIEQALAIRE